MNLTKRAELARDVCEAVRAQRESLDEVGGELALLMGAILSDDEHALPPGCDLERVLREEFDEDHALWSFAREADEDDDGGED